MNMAAALSVPAKTREAEKWARQALAWQPGLVEALSNLSLAVLNQGRPARGRTARAGSRRALARRAAHLHSNLGSILLHQKRFAEAEECLSPRDRAAARLSGGDEQPRSGDAQPGPAGRGWHSYSSRSCCGSRRMPKHGPTGERFGRPKTTRRRH